MRTYEKVNFIFMVFKKRKMVDRQELVKGARFSSFVVLSKAIRSWEEANFVSLYKRSSRTIETASKRATKKAYNCELKYAEVDFACIHGGRKFKSTGTGLRPNQR